MHFRRIDVGAVEGQNRNNRIDVLVIWKRDNTAVMGRGHQFDLENERDESRVITKFFTWVESRWALPFVRHYR